MSKHRRQRNAVAASASERPQKDAAQEAAVATEPARAGWRRFPIWAWVLIYILPLILSEFMFYQAGRVVNMALFPIVWTGFWVTIWYRSTASRRQA